MFPRIIDPSQAPHGWFEERVAKFETAYPDFYKNDDIDCALREAKKIGVPVDVLKTEIGFDLRDRKRMIDYEDARMTPPTRETQEKARKSLKTVESVMSEIGGLRAQFENAMNEAISGLKDFPTDHLNSEEYRGAFSCFLANIPSNPDIPPTNGQMMLGARSIEEATKASLYLLSEIREALIVTLEPKEPPMMAILKRDAEGLGESPDERPGVKPDHFVQGIIRKWAEFFRETTGKPRDGIARLIVGQLVAPVRPEKDKWIDLQEGDAILTRRYKRAREAAEEAPPHWPYKMGPFVMLAKYHQNKKHLKEKADSFLKKSE